MPLNDDVRISAAVSPRRSYCEAGRLGLCVWFVRWRRKSPTVGQKVGEKNVSMWRWLRQVWGGTASVAEVRWLGLRASATCDSVAGGDLGGRVGCEQGLGNLTAKMW